MNLLFFQSPHYSLGVSEMQGMLIQYSQFPFKTRVSLLLSQSGVSRHYSHHFLHATIDLPDPSRSNLTPGPIPRVTPIHRSHVLIDWSLPQGMRCCTVSQTAVAKKMCVHLHLFPAPRIHALEDVHAEYLHVFLSNTSAHRCAFCLRVCLFLKRRCFAWGFY